MERAEITQLCERQVLGAAAGTFGTSQEALGKGMRVLRPVPSIHGNLYIYGGASLDKIFL